MPHDWLNPTIFEVDDPFTAVFDAFAMKLGLTTLPFGGKYLDDWLVTQGGGKLFTFDGNKPVDFEPEPQDTPAIIMWPDFGEPFEFRGEGDRRISIGTVFEGWTYGEDVRLMFAFLYRSLAAVGFPWMEPIDPVAKAGQLADGTSFIQSYHLSGPVGGRAFQSAQGDVCVWKFKVVTEFAGASLPFFRGL